MLVPSRSLRSSSTQRTPMCDEMLVDSSHFCCFIQFLCVCSWVAMCSKKVRLSLLSMCFELNYHCYCSPMCVHVTIFLCLRIRVCLCVCLDIPRAQATVALANIAKHHGRFREVVAASGAPQHAVTVIQAALAVL